MHTYAYTNNVGEKLMFLLTVNKIQEMLSKYNKNFVTLVTQIRTLL